MTIAPPLYYKFDNKQISPKDSMDDYIFYQIRPLDADCYRVMIYLLWCGFVDFDPCFEGVIECQLEIGHIPC
jgi:hypothetical protein